MPALGDVIRGKYRLIRLLGDGGMGSVFEAQHELLGTRVAIKLLHADLARRTGLVDRFLQEARVAAQIKSAHVVQVTDVDRTADGSAFLVMELLEGEALSAMLDRLGKLPIPTACEFARQILEALEAAHALGVVHRDLKPENVLVVYSGGAPVLKLIDFGIAKATRDVPSGRHLTVAGSLMGTAEYMAPEQARSADRVDARSDLYAVGVMLFEMIAGQRPVHGEDGRVIAMKVERGEVTPLVRVAPEVPREVAGLVHRAMAARPELRFASATEMRLALDAALGAGARHGGTVPVAPLGAPAIAPGTGRPRTGTALVTPPPVSGGHRDAVSTAPVHTQRAAPSPVALTPHPPHASGTAWMPDAAPAAPHAPRARRGSSRRIALLALAALVAAGVVVALVVASGATSTPRPSASIALSSPPPIDLTATPTATAPATAAPSATQPAPGGVTPLVPGHGTWPAHAGDAGHGAHGAPSAAPSDAPMPAPGFPTAIPSVLPFPLPSGLPSAFPLPFPSAIPSTFPTALPSTIPFPLPGLPSASPAPSSTSTASPATTL
jgi:serine/threonine-protein kinase